MLIDFDAVAEEYCSCFSDYELIDIRNNGIDFETLKEWVESEVEGFSTDVENLHNAIMNYIDFIVNGDSYSILEDYEITSILAEYVIMKK